MAMQNFNSNFKILNKKVGFSLLDVIFAIGIILVGLITILGLLRYVILAGRLSADRFVAANLAQEGIEIVRSIRDTNWVEPSGGAENGFDGLDASGVNFYEVDYTINEEDPNLVEEHMVADAESSDHLALDTANGFYAYDAGGEQTKFKRVISIEDIDGGNGKRITSRVIWPMLGVNYDVTVEDWLYNWWE